MAGQGQHPSCGGAIAPTISYPTPSPCSPARNYVLSVSPAAAGTLPLLALTLNRWSSTKDIRTGWLAQRVRVAPASAVQSFSPKPTLMGIICANAAGEAGLFGDWSVNLQPGTRNDVPDVLSCVCVGLNLFGIEYIYIDSTKRTFSQINE